MDTLSKIELFLFKTSLVLGKLSTIPVDNYVVLTYLIAT